MSSQVGSKGTSQMIVKRVDIEGNKVNLKLQLTRLILGPFDTEDNLTPRTI